MPQSRERHYLLHPDSFQSLLNLLPEEGLNRMLLETNLLDIGAYAIYQNIYGIAVSSKTKKSQAERLVRSVKLIVKAINIIPSVPEFYTAITKFGKSSLLSFTDAAHVYVSKRQNLILIVQNELQVEKLGKYVKCIDAPSFSRNSVN